MLARYKKSGGFLQLLNLMETTGQPKRDKFMEMIRAEDPRWARALEKKMISFERIMSWDDNAVAEIANTLQDLTLAVLSKGLSPEHKEKMFKMIGNRKRKIDELAATLNPNAGEVSTMLNKVLSETRKMIKEGYLHLNKIDPSLVVEDEIEAKLNKESYDFSETSTSIQSPGHVETVAAAAVSEPTAAGTVLNFDMPHNRPGASGEAVELRKKIESLQKELTMSRQENSILKGKLDQIRKIA